MDERTDARHSRCEEYLRPPRTVHGRLRPGESGPRRTGLPRAAVPAPSAAYRRGSRIARPRGDRKQRTRIDDYRTARGRDRRVGRLVVLESLTLARASAPGLDET